MIKRPELQQFEILGDYEIISSIAPGPGLYCATKISTRACVALQQFPSSALALVRLELEFAPRLNPVDESHLITISDVVVRGSDQIYIVYPYHSPSCALSSRAITAREDEARLLMRQLADGCRVLCRAGINRSVTPQTLFMVGPSLKIAGFCATAPIQGKDLAAVMKSVVTLPLPISKDCADFMQTCQATSSSEGLSQLVSHPFLLRSETTSAVTQFFRLPPATFSLPSGSSSVYLSCRTCTGIFDQIYACSFPKGVVPLVAEAIGHIQHVHSIQLRPCCNTENPQDFVNSLPQASNALVGTYLGLLQLFLKSASVLEKDSIEKKQLLSHAKAITDYNLVSILRLLSDRYGKKAERYLTYVGFLYFMMCQGDAHYSDLAKLVMCGMYSTVDSDSSETKTVIAVARSRFCLLIGTMSQKYVAPYIELNIVDQSSTLTLAKTKDIAAKQDECKSRLKLLALFSRTSYAVIGLAASDKSHVYAETVIGPTILLNVYDFPFACREYSSPTDARHVGKLIMAFSHEFAHVVRFEGASGGCWTKRTPSKFALEAEKGGERPEAGDYWAQSALGVTHEDFTLLMSKGSDEFFSQVAEETMWKKGQLEALIKDEKARIEGETRQGIVQSKKGCWVLLSGEEAGEEEDEGKWTDVCSREVWCQYSD